MKNDMINYNIEYPESICVTAENLKWLVDRISKYFKEMSFVIEAKNEKYTFESVDKVIKYFDKKRKVSFNLKIILKNIEKTVETDNLIITFKNMITGVTDYRFSLVGRGVSNSREKIESIHDILHEYVKKSKIRFWKITKIPFIFTALIILLIIHLVHHINDYDSAKGIIGLVMLVSIGASFSIASMTRTFKRVKNYIFPKVAFKLGVFKKKEKKALILKFLSLLLFIAIVALYIIVF